MATNWDTTFESLPTSLEDAGLGDDRIRTLKAAIRERFVKEHAFDVAEGGTQPRQGLHRAGSAIAFYQASAPTTRNGVALSAADNGILWVDSDTKAIYTWVTSAWVALDISAVSYRMQGVVVKLTSGSGNWTVPTGVTRIRVTCVGGGGGGGGGGNARAGGGGGGTSISAAQTDTLVVTPGASLAYSVGAGGAGGTQGTSDTDGGVGGSGGNTTFSGASTGYGGRGGGPLYGGSGYSQQYPGCASGSPGTPSILGGQCAGGCGAGAGGRGGKTPGVGWALDKAGQPGAYGGGGGGGHGKSDTASGEERGLGPGGSGGSGIIIIEY